MSIENLLPPPPDVKVDLSNCDREQIHLPGVVQNHGMLFALDADLKISHVSGNALKFLGVDATRLIGTRFADLVEEAPAADLTAKLRAENLARHNPLKIIVRDRYGGQAFDAIAHRNGTLIVELEPTTRLHELEFPSFYHYARESVAKLRSSTSQPELYQNAVDLVRAITGFDRVLIYKFDAGWNGHVLAENKAPETTSYLDLHFPASDIPKQARELYLRNPLRLIPDVSYVPVPLAPAHAAKSLDLSQSILRGVSPIHVEYLQNMGASASMSISLVKEGRLWGLISCTHESGPLYPRYEARAVCDFIGEILSSLLPLREYEKNAAARYRLADAQTKIYHAVANEDDFVSSLVRDPAPLLELMNATGAAVYFDGKLSVVGRAPASADIQALIEFLSARDDEDVFHTQSLAQMMPAAAAFMDSACGVLAFSISRGHTNYVLWFRPEVIQTVKWGGNPRKAVEFHDGVPTLHPRKSFEAWKETVRLRSLPWTADEQAAALNLRSAIIDIVLQRAERITRLNTELERSNTELDSFAYAASHDLKEPLRGIYNYASLVLRQNEGKLTDDANGKVQTITRLAQRMENLINSLLHYAQVGRTDLTLRETNLNELVGQTVETLRTRIEERGTVVRIKGTLPTVVADRTQLSEVFTNLMTNAIKYNSSVPPEVEVGCLNNFEGERVTIFVKDNGIGIDPSHHGSVFKIFKRLHGKDEYGGGTGTGLTIARKIIERHDGKLWLESAPGRGTTFFFTLAPLGRSARGQS